MASEQWARWNPRAYLEEYHSRVAADTQHVIRGLIKIIRDNIGGLDTSAILDFGSGPTLYSLLPVGHLFDEIYLADYLSVNLTQIENWAKKTDGMFDWTLHTRFTLRAENSADPSDEEVSERENQIRARLKCLLTCDARKSDPLGSLLRGRFPVVMSLFCPDSITDDKAEWRLLMKNIFSLVAPGGFFIVGALINCESYKVGDERFPSAHISAQDVDDLFAAELDARRGSFISMVIQVPEHRQQGYGELMLGVVRRSG